MTIFEVAIETLTSASEGCDGVGCVVYGMFDDDAAPEYGIELLAHLPTPVGTFGTLVIATEALLALHEDAAHGDHVDIALPTNPATIFTDALATSNSAAVLEGMTEEVADLRLAGITVRITGHDRANGDSLERAEALAALATDPSALAAYRARST